MPLRWTASANAWLRRSVTKVSGPTSPTTSMAARCFMIRACDRQLEFITILVAGYLTDHDRMDASLLRKLLGGDPLCTSILSPPHVHEQPEVNRNSAIGVPGRLEMMVSKEIGTTCHQGHLPRPIPSAGAIRWESRGRRSGFGRGSRSFRARHAGPVRARQGPLEVVQWRSGEWHEGSWLR